MIQEASDDQGQISNKEHSLRQYRACSGPGTVGMRRANSSPKEIYFALSKIVFFPFSFVLQGHFPTRRQRSAPPGFYGRAS